MRKIGNLISQTVGIESSVNEIQIIIVVGQ